MERKRSDQWRILLNTYKQFLINYFGDKSTGLQRRKSNRISELALVETLNI